MFLSWQPREPLVTCSHRPGIAAGQSEALDKGPQALAPQEPLQGLLDLTGLPPDL